MMQIEFDAFIDANQNIPTDYNTLPYDVVHAFNSHFMSTDLIPVDLPEICPLNTYYTVFLGQPVLKVRIIQQVTLP